MDKRKGEIDELIQKGDKILMIKDLIIIKKKR